MTDAHFSFTFVFKQALKVLSSVSLLNPLKQLQTYQ